MTTNVFGSRGKYFAFALLDSQSCSIHQPVNSPTLLQRILRIPVGCLLPTKCNMTMTEIDEELVQRLRAKYSGMSVTDKGSDTSPHVRGSASKQLLPRDNVVTRL
jgi:hypothetical protein